MIIYKTTNLINGKIYIGQASGKRSLSTSDYLGSGKTLKQAIKKYGVENFKRTLIDIGENKKDLNRKERFWINFYDARNCSIGYNIHLGGGGTLSGKDHHDVSGKNNPMYGRDAWNKGTKTGPRPEETKLKIAEVMIKNGVSKGKNNSMYGKKNPGASKWWTEHHAKNRILREAA